MNPYYGSWPHPDARGETAKRHREYDPPSIQREPDRQAPRCPGCGGFVWWDVDRNGQVEAMEGDLVHVCEPNQSLHHLEPRREPEELLIELRRIINHRRLYGEAV